jgi:general secretion pathway protein H
MAERGFTLLELVVVMAVLALIYGVLSVTMTGGRSTLEMQAAARDMAAGLKKARSEAISSNLDIGFFVDVEERRYGIEDRDDAKRMPEGVDVVLHTAEEELASESVGAIRFFPDGSSSGGSIVLSADNQKFEVSVDWLTGHVAVGR